MIGSGDGAGWIIVRQGPTVLAVGAGGVVSLDYHLSFSPLCRLNCHLEGPFEPKQQDSFYLGIAERC